MTFCHAKDNLPHCKTWLSGLQKDTFRFAIFLFLNPSDSRYSEWQFRRANGKRIQSSGLPYSAMRPIRRIFFIYIMITYKQNTDT